MGLWEGLAFSDLKSFPSLGLKELKHVLFQAKKENRSTSQGFFLFWITPLNEVISISIWTIVMGDFFLGGGT